MGSTEPSGEVSSTIRTKFGFCFLIVTPDWLTIAGSDEAACETRFWTSTAPIASGYPTLNVIVMLDEPSFELVEDM